MTDKTRIAELESRLAHQEHTIGQLNDVVVEQQRQLDKLEASMNRLVERLQSGDDPGAEGNPLDELPPHY